MPLRLACLVCTLSIVLPAPALAQLRPYEPSEWELWDGEQFAVASIGAGRFSAQHASLAGEIGRLQEIGYFAAAVRSGRIAIDAGGTLLRRFRRDATFDEPHGGAEPDADGARHDAGDYRIGTTVRLSPSGRPALAILRFGTRLPTTDNRVGLERDQIDFYALLGARLDSGPVRAALESGVGIHGTRNPGYEQSDVLVYLASVGLPAVPLAPAIILAGHADGLPDRAIRGNEELAEVRLRLRGGDRVWVRAEGLLGLAEFSPDWGVTLSVGMTR